MTLNQEQNEFLVKLYETQYRQLCIYAASVLKNKYHVEEVIQDTFRIACTKIVVLMNHPKPEAWLFEVLKYVILNFSRFRARNDMLLRSMDSADNIDRPDDTRFEQDIDFQEDLIHLIGQDDYEIVRLVIFQKCTLSEAARLLGISNETCKKRFQRVKKKLQKKIQENRS